MDSKENTRPSAEQERTLEGGEAPPVAKAATKELHPAFYIALWIGLSSSVIIFNKWVLHSAEFKFPLFLTTWHMVFATVMTQGLAKFTTVLDGRHKVPMTPQLYMRAIVPIGLFFSFSLICGNVAYLYLSVSFIQMLKALNAVVTLLATWAFAISPPDMRKLANVSAIVVGVIIASFGEIKFVMFGFLIQLAGIFFEAVRLVMVQRILSSPEFKMDPLVSLYYYAPACAAINGFFTLFIELPKMGMDDIYRVGVFVLIANAAVAFMLNVSVVFLIGKTSAVVLTLSGVLKDILLVVASMVIFLDPVSPLQFFGYSIALGGLVWYKLGADGVKNGLRDAQVTFGNMRQENPTRANALIGGAIFLVLVLGYFIFGSSITAESQSPFAGQ
ncbi:related to glucose-6-phosphate/phosphate and phosphoenolpyruvate/phosphate antiporter [Ramularia collo-cygni]|uniref:Related to glucose-6-phosphate/phosphate and phosphoenolpyruvate/phosphate antiporter n=1 Tax=Ramularia collo-cygni TaxID=112498 RepID=A0A2D3UND6_9PEZI|nr:related to glucose-6-phosphate/phosphate and phosphoenolpyruvate/phosphate antiporter [Ramularia collo-cygni]CZT16311.1 related to glucose-6-phosphate/phosphate and phosphoenolpyruvate/phosphate antiporter [Ramularia collo-cygni]